MNGGLFSHFEDFHKVNDTDPNVLLRPVATRGQGRGAERGDNGGDTPLHLACWDGHLDVVRYLLTSHDANLEATDSNGRYASSLGLLQWSP